MCMRRTGCVLVSGFRRRVAARSFAFYGAVGEWEGHLGFWARIGVEGSFRGAWDANLRAC